ncbi:MULTISPECIES: dihydrofolate reductase family protein [Niastella]|uniref:RibD family protein n=1 Tax=Niastella soli TaxID=2821487 RepID=A0ABS3YNG1_9BACT|nr:RibD family protein [Niastella soli]MBO9199415.1 RibD family protein [Niastella soli]
MIKRPRVICLMMTSVDGKILGEKWGDDKLVKILKESFEKVHELIGNKSWIVGRTTMEKDFTHYAKPVHKEVDQVIRREDFVANRHADSFAVVIDGHAKLGWNSSDMLGQHVITVLTEPVKDSYLAHLQEIGVSYIFAGKDSVDLKVVLEKLTALFGIETLMLEGGGHLNGSFLNEGLIDEYNQLLLPLADGRMETTSVFEIEEKNRKFDATLLQLQEVKQIEHEVVWLRYKVLGQV